MGAKLSNSIAECEKAIMSKNASILNATKMINQLKIELTKLPGLQPGAAPTESTMSDIHSAQQVYELATLLSVRQEDPEGFERHVSRVKTYYVDYSGVLAPSSLQNLILGLNLMRLLAQNRIGEFHTELELVPADARGDAHISFALTLEQYLMEGSYSRLASARAAMPDPTFAFFVGMLMDGMREKIAACSEHAYQSLSVEAAAKLLSLSSPEELAAFCDDRGWHIDGSLISFAPDADMLAAKEQIPSAELIKRSLEYARELEQII